jgi:hypothetical protein
MARLFREVFAIIIGLCCGYVSRSVKCEYCGNQRSERPGAGLTECATNPQLREVNASGSARKAALAYAEAMPGASSQPTLWWPMRFSNPSLSAGLLHRADDGSAELAPAA